MLPALTLSIAELGSSAWLARCCWTQVHVPGRTCITPRALADETAALLNPLSCHATAAASEDDTPCCAATWPIWLDVSRAGEGLGAACGTVVGDGCDAFGAATCDAFGSFRAVPI